MSHMSSYVTPKNYNPHDEIDTAFEKLELGPWFYPNGGLFYDHMTLLMVYPCIINYPMEKQMEYADAITRRYALNPHFINEQYSFLGDIESAVKNANATGIGNVACMAYYNGPESKYGIFYSELMNQLKNKKA
jgi:hypothetical protein